LNGKKEGNWKEWYVSSRKKPKENIHIMINLVSGENGMKMELSKQKNIKVQFEDYYPKS